ncbi:hypothetical protein [Glutamicibacter halophytocola]|uniref:hypothetical protein n=1 Tax=Glutamicibacter halophytocola TaxID=1933880 RepID=UPI0015C52EE9|nr:hypothetical protein [Glutamicibacter halophytocola]
MRIEFTRRVSWPELPQELRSIIECQLCTHVVGSVSRTGGFSPGSADLLKLRDGRTVFVKAVDAGVNQHAASLHAREAKIAASLPATIPAPKFLSDVRWHGWQALIFAAAEGTCPSVPWKTEELHRVLDTLVSISSTVEVQAVESLPILEEELREDFAGFGRMIKDGFEPDDRWIAQNLEYLDKLSELGADSLSGDDLVHSDLRADNILISDSGDISFVDWPWASRGASWYDALTVLIEARLHVPELDVQAIVDSHPVFESIAPEALVAVLAGLTGFYWDAARRPPIPSMPTLRDYHAQQAVACSSWLKELAG